MIRAIFPENEQFVQEKDALCSKTFWPDVVVCREMWTQTP